MPLAGVKRCAKSDGSVVKRDATDCACAAGAIHSQEPSVSDTTAGSRIMPGSVPYAARQRDDYAGSRRATPKSTWGVTDEPANSRPAAARGCSLYLVVAALGVP